MRDSILLHRRRVPRWYVSTKSPLLDEQGNVIGLAGAMYRIETQEELTHYFQELLPVVKHIEQHYAEPITMSAIPTRAT